MLQAMRQNTKVILWIVIAAFVGLIFGVWGMDLQRSDSPQGGAIGKVNGQPISYEDFRAAYDQEVQTYQAQTDMPVMPGVAKALEEQAWTRAVNQVIIDNALRGEHIVISDEEVVHNIRTNPPEFIRASETFLTNGQFDYQKYIQYVNDPNVDWRWLEDYLRQQLPVNHLQQRIASEAMITEGELRTLYQQSSETVDFSYIAFKPEDFSDREVAWTDQDIRDWYDANQENYRTEERAELEYVVVPVEVTEADRAEKRRVMEEDVLPQIERGTAFEDLARFYSQGPTAQNGGNLGSFRKGTMTPELEARAFGLGDGQVSEIIEDDQGIQVLQCVSRTGEGEDVSVELRQIFLRLEPGDATYAKARGDIEDLKNRASESGLATAAAESSVNLRSTGPFGRGTYVPGLGELAPANLFAFSGDPGEVSDPILHGGDYYLFSVASRDSSRIAVLDEVRPQVEMAVEKEKRLVFARENASEFASSVADGAGPGGPRPLRLSGRAESRFDLTAFRDSRTGQRPRSRARRVCRARVGYRRARPYRFRQLFRAV